MATPVAQRKESYSGQHEPGFKDQLKAVLARCDYFEIQTNNKGQNRNLPQGTMSPNFNLHQPSNDYDKGMIIKAGYVLVKGEDSLGNQREGYIHPSQVKAFSEWFIKPEVSTSTFLADAARPKAPAIPHRVIHGVHGDPKTYTKSFQQTVGSPSTLRPPPSFETSSGAESLPKDSVITFYKNGQIKYAKLSSDFTIQDVPCAKESFVTFHENGQIKTVKLATEATLQGIRLPQGSFVEFDEKGKLINAIDRSGRPLPKN